MDKKKLFLVVFVVIIAIVLMVVVFNKDTNTDNTGVQNKEPEILHNIPVTDKPTTNSGNTQVGEESEIEFNDNLVLDNFAPIF